MLTSLGQSSMVLAQQSAVVLGVTLYNASSVAWTHMEPYLVHFMQTVIDTPTHQSIHNRQSRNMQGVSGTEVNGEEGGDTESVSVQIGGEEGRDRGEVSTSDIDWKTLPETPTSSPIIEKQGVVEDKIDSMTPAETVVREEGTV
ncbi:hypothetical protein EON65_01375 [archaeon]|nr:MAG: hypothetical protein EON65_01375 [archaeon]